MDTRITSITSPELSPMIEQNFAIYPTGILIRNGQVPPAEIFDLLGYYLSVKGDEMRWQVGSYCAMYSHYYPEIYKIKAQQFFIKPQTIEVWATVCRQIPFEIRIPELSIWYHKLVAPIDDTETQERYLKHCLDNGMKYREFEEWVYKQRNLPIPPSYEDRQFQRQVDEQKELNQLTKLYNDLSLRLAETETENKELRKQVENSQPNHVSTIITRLSTILDLEPLAAARNIVQIFNELKSIVEELKRL